MAPTRELQDQGRNLALLIDGDNAQASLIANILAETAKYGTTTVRRVYGDWTTPQMGGWKKTLQSHALHPQQQFRNTSGKNATDSALIIDAMDLLHSGTIGGFCIVSSDADFTRLATRIREQGLFVMGIGKPETPTSFVNACGLFVYTTNLDPKTKKKAKPKKTTDESDWTQTVRKAIEAASQDDEWASLSLVGKCVRDLEPAFDPRTYNHKKLTSLIASRPDLFQTRALKTDGRDRPLTEVRLAP